MNKTTLRFYKTLASTLFPPDYAKVIEYDIPGVNALRQFFLLNVYHNLPLHDYDVENCISTFFNSYVYDLQFMSYVEFMTYVFEKLQLNQPGYFGQPWFNSPKDAKSFILNSVNTPIRF